MSNEITYCDGCGLILNRFSCQNINGEPYCSECYSTRSDFFFNIPYDSEPLTPKELRLMLLLVFVIVTGLIVAGRYDVQVQVKHAECYTQLTCGEDDNGRPVNFSP